MAEGGDKPQNKSLSLENMAKAKLKGVEYLPLVHIWDPTKISEWDDQPPLTTCILRIKRDLMNMYNEPPPGMFVFPEPENITKVHALIIGPIGTPYEGGFFYFILRFPPDYPMHPPRVKFITTGHGTVRFNPNLYKNGKVCLSIIGTWSGPPWSPAQCLSSVLISIQSLLNEKPYHNEPGFEKGTQEDSNRYNDIIQHETIRVAVCDMLDGQGYEASTFPAAFQEVKEKSFLEYYDYYVATAKDKAKLNSKAMRDPFGEKRGAFTYCELLTRLEAIKQRLIDKKISPRKAETVKMIPKEMEETDDDDDFDEDFLDYLQETDSEVEDVE